MRNGMPWCAATDSPPATIMNSAMHKNARIFVAGHRGLAGSAIMRQLASQGYTKVLARTHAELDLADGTAVQAFFRDTKPEFVILAAAKVGGIHANSTFPAEFIHNNLAIQINVIHQAYLHGVNRLLFLGSSCIYPRMAPQPIREDSLLSGPLEPTNRPYAVAKIAGIEMCWSYNRQYGTRSLAVMPTNLYGPGDNYHPENSHVIPGLIHKFHEAKVCGAQSVQVWGTGAPRREFLYSDDMAKACLHLLTLPEERYAALLGTTTVIDVNSQPPLVNIGVGHDVTISELAELVKSTVGFSGRIEFDVTKPDGPPQKLLDVSRITQTGWTANTTLENGLEQAYAEYLSTRE